MTRLTKTPLAVLVVALLTVDLSIAVAAAPDFRPPAVPLVTYNPFLSIWSEADHLNDATTKHWTRHDHSLVSLIRIDGKTYRLMGGEPKTVPAFAQKSVAVLPTRSIYEFEEAGVHVTLTFMQPALPADLDVYSWPLSYITWNVRSCDGAQHKIEIYDSVSSQLAVNKTSELVEWSRQTVNDLTLVRVGTQAQNVLGSCGDDHRINWGYAYAAAPRERSTRSAIGASAVLEQSFVGNGGLPDGDDTRMPRAASDAEPAMAFVFDLGSIGAEAVERQVIVAYDEIFAIKYYGQRLLPYWARNGVKIAELLQTASDHYARLLARCESFDKELMADLTKVGGEKYAKITALSYRECVAANGLAADANKQPLFFTKENTSNGDIATVDVFFPMDPIWILLSPSLAKASLVHVLMYSASAHWKFPNAPHDLGTYPFVTGRDDGGEGMPVEESGNMLILCAAIAHAEGNADFVRPWWPQLTHWAKYLEKYGLDPEEQLCTDDFMGHLAHNANLSVKAILGLAAYGDLSRMRGDKETADRYFALARADAKHWIEVAAEGDHYRLAFDKPGTWSQKYNLVWDRILGLNVFPPAVARQEVAHYKRMMLRYGVPLDSRTRLTKTDWSFWSATLAENQSDFEALIAPVYDYLNATTVRDPIADSYVTDDNRSGGMHARPVVGGFFIKMLTDRVLWEKWASRDKLKPWNYAPLPAPPKISMIVPAEQTWRYTTRDPGNNWTKSGFDATGWKEGQAGFGTSPPRFVRHTEWTTKDIWLRREITVPEGEHPDLQFVAYHDEDVEIHVNGIPAAQESGFTTSFVPLEISRQARAALQPGAKVLVAVHCHQTEGGQGIDVGLAEVTDAAAQPQAQVPAGAPVPSSYPLWEFGTMPRPAFKQVLLGNPAVQKELNLTAAQKKKMEDTRNRQFERIQKARREITDREKFLKARETISNETLAAILENLNLRQRDRLDQIQLQSQGPLAFNRSRSARWEMDGPDLAKLLKLSDDQVKRAQAIAEEGDTEIEKAAAVPIVLDHKAGAPTAESIRKLVQTPEFKAAKQKTRKAARKAWDSVIQRIEQVLTESQRTAYRKLLGAPFDLLKIRFTEDESAEDADNVANALNVGGGGGGGGQQADPNFDTKVARPAYKTKHPRVLFDEAHNNFHTSGGRYKPFADIIAHDGFQVIPNKEKFTRQMLARGNILIIVNALGAEGMGQAGAANSAFTEAECDAVRDWVQAGGSLLLITDHTPFGAAAQSLARRFGVDMSKGYTSDPANSEGSETRLLFTRKNNLLGDHAIMQGRDDSERINRIETFTGQSLKGPPGSVAILKLGDTAFDEGDDGKHTSAAGRAQGIAFAFGKGRVVVMGEAAELSAQLVGTQPFGMNMPGLDNRQMAINIMHWLSGLLEPRGQKR